MTKKSILRLLQASLMCCLAVLFTACDDIFANGDNPRPAYLSIIEKPVTIKIGDTYKRTASSLSDVVIEYTSSNTNVATVDNSGLVTAIAEGTATITATATGYSSQNGKKIYQPDSKSYKLTVKPATLPAATITTAPVATTGDIAAGSTTALVTAGVADGGTMMYQATATNAKPTTTDGFSATVPTAATLADGTYYVWYYAKGDASHSDSEIAATAIEVTVTEVYAAYEYKEGSWDGTKVVFTKQAAMTATAVTSSAAPVTWGDGWYTVSGTVTITGNVTLGANTHLILQDGAKLTINGRILGSNKNLSIYGQANQTGQLVVNYSNNDAIRSIITLEVHGCQVTATSSASGCGGFDGIVTFNVYGGSVDAESTGTNGNGIYLAYNGSMNIYGGDVKAVGKGNSYGIKGSSSTVTVYGGKLWAENADNKALLSTVTLAKGASFTGKIETSGDGSSWTEYTTSGTPTTKYVRVGY